MSSAREFAIIPPDLRFSGLLVAFVLFSCVGALTVSWQALRGSPIFWLMVLAAFATLTLVLLALFHHKVVLEDESLHIVAGLNRACVPAASLLVNEARIVDLTTNSEYRLGRKHNGTALPGYHAGHFRQADGRKIFALITDKRRVLVLPERDGRLVMLSLEKPQTLLDALQRSARTQ